MPELGDAGTAEAVALPNGVQPLDPVTCRWDADTYESDKPLPLSASWETDKPFARFTRATKLDVIFSETNVDVVGVSFVEPGGAFSLRAIMPTAELALYPKKARVVEGWFVPSSAVAFTKPRLEPAVKQAVVDLACPGVEPAGALTTEWPCEEIGILPNRYELDTMLPRERVRDASLAKNRRIPLATTAKGTTVASLKITGSIPANVVVTETSGAESRIVWRTQQCAVFGWVPTKDLGAATKHAKPKPAGKPPSKHAPSPKAETPVETRTCKGAVPFVVRDTRIGELYPDRPIDIAEHQQDGWSRLVLPNAGGLAETHFLARTSELELCAKKENATP